MRSAEELFASIHASQVAMKPYQHIGLQNLRKLNDDCAQACNFQNFLVIQPEVKIDHDSLFYSRENASDHWAKLNAYPLMMQCELTKDGLTAMASFDNAVLSEHEIDLLLEQFASIIDQLSNSTSLVGSIGLLNQNSSSLRVKEAGVEQLQFCVHDIILQTSRKLWDELAITSWDGDMTHRQLQSLSDRLTLHLQSLGAGSGVMIALVFEKSLWVIVAMLAIMKCGAVFVPMHHDHPRSRIQELVDQIGGKLMVCSSNLLHSFTGIAENTIPVGRSTVEELPESPSPITANATPKSTIYVMFTPRGYLKEDKMLPMGLGAPLSRYSIISDRSEDDTRHSFVWTLHHAVYDAWSLGLLLRQLEGEYKSLTKSFTNETDFESSHFIPFNRFIQDIQRLDKANAVGFWKSEPAADCSEPMHFPLVENEYQPQPNAVIVKDIELNCTTNSNIRTSNFSRTAWAITLSNYTNSTDVVFGEVLTGRTGSTIDSTRVAGPTLATVPVRISFDTHGTVQELLEKVQNKMLRLMPFEQTGMSSIQSISSELKKACNFQNLVVIQPKENSVLDESFLGRRQLDLVGMNGWDTTALTLECSLTTHGLGAKAIFDSKLVSEGQMDRILSQFEHILSRLCREEVGKTIHNINSIKSKVPMLFMKSKWAVVAMLAIIKAGAAFVPCDPSHPRSRLQSIFEQIDARVVLCCDGVEWMCLEILPHGQTIVVGEQSGFALLSGPSAISSGVKPHNTLYICFTSGTSGTPKGTVITHQAYCSGARDHSKALHFERTSRFLQFASYTFDTSIEDILTTLISGGCLCIPSEERFSGIPGAIARMNVNAADLTPSYISSISPNSVPSLKQVTLGGEPITANVIKIWANHVRLINAYGTTECCVTSICREVSADTHPANIGHPVGAVTWIVAAENSDQLLPIGAVGELLIEGPAMAEGYLNDKEKTAPAFISSPKWARNINSHSRPRRLYRTGDLAQYNSDGSINYLGRKDTRMKLRGLRIEMGDVEHHLLSYPSVRRAMVVLPTAGPYSDQLTAILELHGTNEPNIHSGIDIMSKSELEASNFDWSIISAHLKERLPAYMAPSSWIVIKIMPLHSSGKLDRSKLGKWLVDLPEKSHIDVYLSSSNIPSISPDDHVALEISKIIAQLMSSSKQGDPEIVDHDVNIYSIGIDSIKMMSLAAFIKRSYGVAIAMPLLLHHETKITDISKYIAEATRTNSKNGVLPEQVHDVDLMKELLALDHDLASFQHYFGVVFLTGASGFLGTQLLRELLNRPGIEKVIAHVRAIDETHGKQRIINAAKAAKWWSESLAPKLEVWAGDLAKPMLGLSTTQWQALQETNAIIHNGASVKWNENYHNLKAANVTSTFSLLKLISTALSPPKFVYVSGGRDLAQNMNDKEIAAMMGNQDGYSQTKLVSELLVRNFARRATTNQHISTVKPGLIIGTAKEGVANTTDFLWRYVAGAMSIGCYPIPAKDDWLRVANVDRVANTTINALLRGSGSTQNHNQSHTTEVLVGIDMHKFWAVVNARVRREKQLQPVSAEEWYNLVQRDLETRTEEHPLWPVAHFLAEQGNLGKAGRPMGGDGDEMAAKEVEVALGKNVEFLREIGYFGVGK
ncbi:non-ribosomal peptide synthetase protein [Rutstroemia sp. NJR-2017a BVV2]|nr:non-ribosomal peptide synthetase protein [Rutstroemia sp. NJR-2017a BVV2]